MLRVTNLFVIDCVIDLRRYFTASCASIKLHTEVHILSKTFSKKTDFKKMTFLDFETESGCFHK